MTLRIALLMMQKNENILLEPWITYHRNLVDSASIFIFDNGSSEPRTLSILRAAENSGIMINRAFCELRHYHERGIIFANLIKQLDQSNPHDFYFPIDCDEFLACDTNGSLSCRQDDIEKSLISLLGSDKVLTIPHKYINNPYSPNLYSKITHCKKCFFPKDTCESMTDGFHDGQTRSGLAQQESNITYFEFHFKPYSDYLRMSRQKIEYLVPNQSRRALADYVKTRKSNFHAAMALLESEYSYLRSFEIQTYPRCRDTSLLQRFSDLGIDSTQLFDPRGKPRPLRRTQLLARHQLLLTRDRVDAFFYWVRSRASAVKRLLGL
jgi:hypothetical protein